MSVFVSPPSSSKGSTPYPGMEAREVMRRVKDGHRLERPSHCRPEFYRLMSRCWHSDPQRRPDFGELKSELGQLLDDADGYIDLDSFQESIYVPLQSPSDESEKIWVKKQFFFLLFFVSFAHHIASSTSASFFLYYYYYFFIFAHPSIHPIHPIFDSISILWRNACPAVFSYIFYGKRKIWIVFVSINEPRETQTWQAGCRAFVEYLNFFITIFCFFPTFLIIILHILFFFFSIVFRNLFGSFFLKNRNGGRERNKRRTLSECLFKTNKNK